MGHGIRVLLAYQIILTVATYEPNTVCAHWVQHEAGSNDVLGPLSSHSPQSMRHQSGNGTSGFKVLFFQNPDHQSRKCSLEIIFKL